MFCEHHQYAENGMGMYALLYRRVMVWQMYQNLYDVGVSNAITEHNIRTLRRMRDAALEEFNHWMFKRIGMEMFYVFQIFSARENGITPQGLFVSEGEESVARFASDAVLATVKSDPIIIETSTPPTSVPREKVFLYCLFAPPRQHTFKEVPLDTVPAIQRCT